MKQTITHLQGVLTRYWEQFYRSFLQLFKSPVGILISYFALTLFCRSALAADFDLPAVSITGMDGKKDPIAMIVLLIKYVVKAIVWLFVIGVGLTLLRNTIKSVNKARRDEEGKWGEVAGEVVGNTVIVIAVIAFGAWVNGLIA